MAGDEAFGRCTGTEPGAMSFERLRQRCPSALERPLRLFSSLELSKGATPGSAAVGVVHAHYSTWPMMRPFGRRIGAEPGAIHFLVEGLPEVTLVQSILRAWSISLELS